MTKVFLGITAYVFFTFLLAYIWNMVIFRDQYLLMAGSSLREAPIMQLGVITIFLEGIALSILFSMYFTSDQTLMHGAILGLLVGVFSIAYAGLTVPAKFVIDPVWKYSALELLFGVIHFAVAGVILAFIYSRFPE